jgi:NAD(P)-dependent dehydrogenase (short-subunit alcohol dehydrogenase family)
MARTRKASAPGRVVVITGGTAGVGRATAQAFARTGARVAVLARGEDGLVATKAEIESQGGQALALSVDVADVDAVEAAADAVEAHWGPVDVWVNDAMTGVFAPFMEVTPEEFRRVTEVVYLGSVNGTRAALRSMQPRDRGHVIQVGSALAFRGIPLQSAYCGAKHALEGFLDSVRTELLHDGSKVVLTSVHLPAMNTPQFRIVASKMPRLAQPVPPIYQPEVAARAIVWAADHRRREIWVAGSTVGTILGSRAISGLLDHYLGRTGYASQLTDQPRAADAAANLWSSVPGDHGAHGAFDGRAHPRSLQLTLSLHRARTVAGGLLAAVVGAAALRRRGH